MSPRTRRAFATLGALRLHPTFVMSAMPRRTPGSAHQLAKPLTAGLVVTTQAATRPHPASTTSPNSSASASRPPTTSPRPSPSTAWTMPPGRYSAKTSTPRRVRSGLQRSGSDRTPHLHPQPRLQVVVRQRDQPRLHRRRIRNPLIAPHLVIGMPFAPATKTADLPALPRSCRQCATSTPPKSSPTGARPNSPRRASGFRCSSTASASSTTSSRNRAVLAAPACPA